MQSISFIGGLPLRQQWAYDVCSLAVHEAGEPCLLLTSGAHPWGALAARLSRVTAVAAGESLDALEGAGRPFASAVWLEPPATAELVRQVTQLLRPGAPLSLVAFGPLARLTGEGPPKGLPRGDLGQALRALRHQGFAVEASYGFGGPASLLWRSGVALAERLGAWPWADAVEARARRCFAATPARWWHPLRVVVVRAP